MSSRMAEHLKPGNIDWWPRYEAMLTLAHLLVGLYMATTLWRAA